MNKEEISKLIKSISLEDINIDIAKLKHVDLDKISQLTKIGNNIVDYFTFTERLNTLTKKKLSFFDFYKNRNLFLSKFPDSIYFSEVEIKNPFVHSIYLLASVIAMSKTRIVVSSSGNVSLWTALYRGSANNIIQYLNPKEFIYGERNPNYDPNLTQFWI